MKMSELMERLKTIKDILMDEKGNAASPDLVEAVDVVIGMLDLPVSTKRPPRNRGRLAKLKAKRQNPTPEEIEETIEALFGPFFGWMNDR
jgi:hypothetical protein